VSLSKGAERGGRNRIREFIVADEEMDLPSLVTVKGWLEGIEEGGLRIGGWGYGDYAGRAYQLERRWGGENRGLDKWES